MKRLLLFIIVILAANTIYCQNIDYSASLETGYYREKIQMIRARINHPNPAFYSEIKAGIHLFDRRLNFKSSVFTSFIDNSHFMNFTPVLAEYETNLYYDFNSLPLKIGWKHACKHTVKSDDLGQIYDGAYDRIYLKLKIK